MSLEDEIKDLAKTEYAAKSFAREIGKQNRKKEKEDRDKEARAEKRRKEEERDRAAFSAKLDQIRGKEEAYWSILFKAQKFSKRHQLDLTPDATQTKLEQRAKEHINNVAKGLEDTIDVTQLAGLNEFNEWLELDSPDVIQKLSHLGLREKRDALLKIWNEVTDNGQILQPPEAPAWANLEAEATQTSLPVKILRRSFAVITAIAAIPPAAGDNSADLTTQLFSGLVICLLILLIPFVSRVAARIPILNQLVVRSWISYVMSLLWWVFIIQQQM